MRRRLAAGLIVACSLLAPANAAWADHDYDDGGYEDGGSSQEYEGNWSNEDRNRNRNRDRGAFSPGPFRDSPVYICSPYSCNSGGEQSGDNQNNPPPDEEQRVGFFPPDPRKIPAQIQAFMTLTVDFVQGVITFAV